MTKTIVIRTCYFLIALWIILSVLAFLPINYYLNIINSIDENGCRISLLDNSKIVCPDLPIQKDPIGNLICSKCGTWETMNPPETLYLFFSMMVVIEVLIQIIAFICWNMHFKWFKLELKSCWSNESKTES